MAGKDDLNRLAHRIVGRTSGPASGEERITLESRCDECGGNGLLPGNNPRRGCPVCRGEGYTERQITLAELHAMLAELDD
jgi:DnaJ-class molecular chaperone